MDKVIRRVEELAKKVCADYDVALYDVELKTARKGLIVVVFILKIDGVTIEDCSNVSRSLGYLLEEEDLFPGRYFLEVSSPGLERALKLKKHYVSAINETVKITFSEEERVRTEIGVLKEVSGSNITLEMNGKNVLIAFNDIKKAKTHFDFKKEKR